MCVCVCVHCKKNVINVVPSCNEYLRWIHSNVKFLTIM